MYADTRHEVTPHEVTPVARELSAEAKILLKAADLIRTRGHAKGIQLADDGSMCIHGAINIAATGRAYMDAATAHIAAKVYDYLTPRIIRPFPGYIKPNGLAYWNNERVRTKEEVIAALEGAAAA